MKEMSMNKLYKIYMEGNHSKEIEDGLYNQALKLGLKEYNKGFQYSIDEEDAKSIIGFTLMNSIKNYDPNRGKSTFATYLTSAIKTNLGHEGKISKKLDENNISQQLKQISINDPIGYDRDGKVLPLENVLGIEDEYLDKEYENELKEEIVCKSIFKYNPEVASKKKMHDIMIQIIDKLMEEKTYEQIAKDLGYKNRADIHQIVKRIQKGAAQLDEFRGCKPSKRTKKEKVAV